MDDSKHFLSLHALHWFRCVLSIGQRPLNSPCALQVYTRLRWMLRLKKPEQPVQKENDEDTVKSPLPIKQIVLGFQAFSFVL